MKVSELASLGGVGVETIRFYQRKGLLAVPACRRNGYRQYGQADADRLLFIRRAKELGFTLEEIAALLRLSAEDCDGVEELARERIDAVDARLRDLRRVRSALAGVLDRCEHREAHEGCPIIEALTRPLARPATRRLALA